MGARLYVPLVFAWMFVTVPPKSAPVSRRLRWLEITVQALRDEIPGPHGMQAMRLLPVLVSVQRSTARLV